MQSNNYTCPFVWIFLWQKVVFETQKIIFTFGKVFNTAFSKKLCFEMWRPMHILYILARQLWAAVAKRINAFSQQKNITVVGFLFFLNCPWFFLLLYVAVLQHLVFFFFFCVASSSSLLYFFFNLRLTYLVSKKIKINLLN